MNKKSFAERSSVFDTIIRISGAISLLAGTVSLILWIIGKGNITSVIEGSKPISPGSSFFSLFFGLILFTDSYRVTGAMKNRIIAGTAFFSLYSLLVAIGYFTKTDLTLTETFFNLNKGLIIHQDIKSSPVSSFLFFLTGIGILLRMYSPANKKLMSITGGIGMMCFLFGMTILRSYIVGDPFFYSFATLPLSIITSIVIAVLGFGLLFMSGRDFYFTKPFFGNSGSARLLRYTIPAILLFLLFDDIVDSTMPQFNLQFYILLSSVGTIFLLIVCIWLIITSTRNVFRQAELDAENLKLSEERYQALVEWSPYAAVVHMDMKIIYANPAAVKLFGAKSETELIGTP